MPQNDVSLVTATAIALGSMKLTDIVKRVLWDAGLDKVPSQAKAITATAFAVGGSTFIESSGRRRVLTACASVGLASLLHSAERTIRARGDVDRIAAVRESHRR
jgi:hypothetical protein